MDHRSEEYVMYQATITPEVTAPSSDVMQELIRLRAENAALKAKPIKALAFKVSEKGAVSVYGLGRFPVTLYRTQWVRLYNSFEELNKFIAANGSRLKDKE